MSLSSSRMLPRLIGTAALIAGSMSAASVVHSRPSQAADAPRAALVWVAAASSSAHAADAHSKKSTTHTSSSSGKQTSTKHARSSMRGKASWYGKRFSGKDTASGEDFNPRHMTAAHPTLPLGTRVRVTNLDNNKSAELRVNDRMPKKSRRLIDVSHAAAKKLDFAEDGLTDVKVDVLHRPSGK